MMTERCSRYTMAKMASARPLLLAAVLLGALPSLDCFEPGGVHDLVLGAPAGGAATSAGFWTVAEVAEWLAESGFGPYAEVFAQEDVDGQRLLALRYHALEEMGVHPDSERKFMLQKINELREELRKNASHIWEWRAAHRRRADTLVAGINNCPRATLFYLKHFEPELVRKVFKGASGLGFWSAWLVCPRLEIAHYLNEFKHVHPTLVTHSWVTAVGLTITEGSGWLLLLLAPHRLPAGERGVDGDLVKSTLSKAVMVGGLWIGYPMVPHALQDVCFFVLLLWPYIGMLMGVFYVVGVFKFALNALVGEQDKQAQE